MSRTPVGDHAFLSDCRSSALVTGGSVDWLCLPRFDSPPVFARLLDDAAGHFSIRPQDPSATATRRYLPMGLVLETTWTCAHGELVVQDALALDDHERGHRLGRSSPGILLRSARCESGSVRLAWEYVPRPEFGLVHPQLHAVPGGVISSGGATVLLLSTDAPFTVQASTVAGTPTLTEGERLAWAVQQVDAWDPAPRTISARSVSASPRHSRPGKAGRRCTSGMRARCVPGSI